MDQAASKSPNSGKAAAADAPTQAPGNLDATLPLGAGLPPPPPPQNAGPPATLLGPYELIEMLGRGGMGTVWKARHTKLDKLVALKVLPAHLMSDADAVSRFEREMKAVGKLEHAHIVRAMDAGQADGVHYLVMEYIEGVDLARLVKHRGPRKVNEACQMIRHAALGLAHAHEHGLVHRDIKPSNLLLSKRGFVKVLDLGLARLQGEKAAGEASLTVNGEMMGTPDYMAPEQWQSAHSVGPAADLYALGCTLYFLLTGHAPFAAADQSTYTQKMTAHLLQPPPALPDAPPELETLYQKLMAKAPEQRPASAKDVADELRSMIRSWTTSPAPVETIPWTPVGSRESRVSGETSAVRAPRRAAVRRWWITGMAAAAVAVALGLAAWSVLGRKPQSGDELHSRAERGNEGNATSAPSRPAPPLAIAPFDAEQARKHQEAWAVHLGVPFEYENSLGMKFVLVPPGEYTRGTAPDRVAPLQENFKKSVEGKLSAESQEKGLACIASESPSHRVRISRPFYLSAYEVTQHDFEQIMGQNRSFFGPTGGGFDGKAPRARALPVENMSYDEAVEFCRRLGQREGLGNSGEYRLPTDAEWEYACRAGTAGPFWFGSPLQDHTPYARWGEGSPLLVARGMPELRRKPNPYGLYDMHGNVCELCDDFFAADDFARFTSAIVESPRGPATGNAHVARGGGYGSVGVMCRSASRQPFHSPQSNVGFRPVLAVAAVKEKLSLSAAKTAAASGAGINAASPEAKEMFEVGRKLCFVEDDWQRGTKLLAKGHLAGIRNAASGELAAPASPQQQAEIGKLWYDAAAGAPDPDNWHCYRRARSWLTKALDEGKEAEKEAWYEAAKRQLALVPMLRATLRIKTSSFNNETIIIGRNQVEWISRDGQGPNVLSDANSTREFISFKSKYGVQERHAFDLTDARWLLPEAVDFSTARLRAIRKEGKTGPYVKAMIDKTRSDQSKVVVRIAEWDNQRNKGASYYGLFELEALLSFGTPD